MSIEHVEVLVEEPSMEAALRILLPKIVGNMSFQIYVHQCKDDLMKCLPQRLRGYAKWLPRNWRILVVVDRDDDDCEALKNRLENMAADAGLITKSRSADSNYRVANRLAIEELEAWYFGDWIAVQGAYPRVPRNIPSKAKFRDPDTITGGTWEAFERILQKAGYFKGGLRKIEAARSVAEFMNPQCNKSQSFQIFRATLEEMAAP